ncbi:MAG TPA: cell division protein FtsA, partial [Opitutales bacterium]|nr:cell division protein FtsA [Opitutales bacterium]
MGRSKIAAALEMGSSKIAVLVGEIAPGKTLNIIGMSEVSSNGISKGEIYDFKAASLSAHEALAAAEKSAGVSLDEVFLGISGGHLQGFYNEATVTVSASNSVVAAADVERACRDAKAKQLPQERIYLHHVHNGYELDGRAVVNPVGAQGQKLSAAYWSVHAHTHKVRDAIHVVNGFGLTVEDVIISSLASGVMVSSEAERQNGLLVIDLGAGTSDYVLYRRGFAALTGCLPVGSGHISNDLSLGLRIPSKNAEALKLEFG